MRLIAVMIFCLLLALGHSRHALAEGICPNPGFEELGPNGIPAGWAPVRIGNEEQVKATLVEATTGSHSGKHALRIKSDADGIAGTNGPRLTWLAGRVSFWYQCLSASKDRNNVTVQMIPLLGAGTEGGGARAVYTIPAEHVGDGKWHQGLIEYNYLNSSTASVIVAARINEGGGGTRGPGELLLDDVEVAKLPGQIKILGFGPVRATCELDEPVKVIARIANTGGEPLENLALTFKAPAECAQDESRLTPEFEVPAPGKTITAEWQIRPTAKGIHTISLKATSRSCEPATATAMLAAGYQLPALPALDSACWAEEMPEMLIMQNTHLKLVFFRDKAGYRLLRVYSRPNGGEKLMAASFPLSQVIVQTAKGPESLPIVPAKANVWSRNDRADARFLGSVTDSDGTRWSFSASFSLDTTSKAVRVAYQIAPDRPTKLLRLDGPSLLAGEGSFGARKSFAQFPGLEYLVGDQRSSEGWKDPERLANRFAPHPYKVTQPIMLVGEGEDTVGLVWDPLQKWCGDHIAPQPLFASPNFLESQENHRMGLFVPTVPDWVEENTLVAARPFSVKADEPVRIKAEIFVEEGLNAYTAAAQWLRMKGVPEPPASPRTLEQAMKFCVDSELETLWVPEAKGWRAHLPTSFAGLSQPHANVGIAELLWAYSIRGADKATRDKIRSQCRTAMEATMQGGSLGVGHLQYSFLSGDVAHALEAARRGIQGTLDSQKSDGSWRFDYTEDRFQDIGDKGDVAVGTCASRANELLQFALITGDPKAESAGLKALDFMDTLTRPEGAQTWEVPLHVPDVVAAGHAVNAYLAGYQLTGEKRYLRRAVDFGYSGLPFAYTWNPPDRPIMRYGTIPVLGTTWHALPWYGLIVQWCGLVHTDALLNLAKFDQSFPWRRFAEGELICGLQLQEGPGKPMQGTYPDVFSAITGKEPFTVPYIHPQLHMSCLFSLLNLPGRPETTVLRDGDSRVSITSAAQVSNARLSAGKVSFELASPSGETSYTLITWPKATVLKDGKPLEKVKDLSSVEEGAQETPDGVVVKIRHGGEKVSVVVSGPTP